MPGSAPSLRSGAEHGRLADGGVVAGVGQASGHLGERVLIAAAHRALEIPGLVAELLEAGLGGQVGHDRSFRVPADTEARRDPAHRPWMVFGEWPR
jgi:hypothetical protein